MPSCLRSSMQDLKTTWFERALFFSWYCKIQDCAFCYMSAVSHGKSALRGKASLLAETLICKKLGWRIGFISGGIGAFTWDELEDILKDITTVYGEKVWLNVGPVGGSLLERYVPYVKGVVGSLETVNWDLRKKVCPSKPPEPYFRMFERAHALGLQSAVSIIAGLGETLDDYEHLKEVIQKYHITKVHLYGFLPQKGTAMENHPIPSVEYQAAWISKIRQDFPDVDIQCGIWASRVDYVKQLLEAGATSISKFPVLRKFGSQAAQDVEQQARLAGREFLGSLSKMPDVDWDREIAGLEFDEQLKQDIKDKLERYLENMKKHCALPLLS